MLRVLRKTFYQTVTLGKKSLTSMVLRALQGGASLCAELASPQGGYCFCSVMAMVLR